MVRRPLSLMPQEPPILITGVAGFIGAAVARTLVGTGVPVLGLDDLSAGHAARVADLPESRFSMCHGDVRDGELLDRLLREHRPRTILHLAARVGVRRVLRDPRACEQENLEGGRVLANALIRASAYGCNPRVIAASTSEVYAESNSPLAESSRLRPDAAEGRWRYAASKRLAEEALDLAASAASAPAPVHLRFFNVVGPGQDAASGMVLPRFIESARRGDSIEVYGTGDQVRTFAHVDSVARDVASLVAPHRLGHAQEHDGRGAHEDIASTLAGFSGPLNVGGTARSTILDLAELVATEVEEATGLACSIVPRDPRVAVSANFEEVIHRVPDLSRLQRLGLGQKPWSLTEIVRDTVARHRSLQPATFAAATSAAARRGAPGLCASPAS